MGAAEGRSPWVFFVDLTETVVVVLVKTDTLYLLDKVLLLLLLVYYGAEISSQKFSYFLFPVMDPIYYSEEDIKN